MNYQDNLNNIKRIEEIKNRTELNFTGIITDIWKDQSKNNGYNITIANKHIIKFAYDKTFHDYWFESDLESHKILNRLLGRVVEFNFKNNEIFNDERDNQIIISKIYGHGCFSNTYDSWDISNTLIEKMEELKRNREHETEDVICIIETENDNISSNLLQEYSFPGFSYNWIEDFIFNLFTYNHKDTFNINLNDYLFIECFVNFILKDIEYYFHNNKEYNYGAILRLAANTISAYLKIKIQKEASTIRQIKIIREIQEELNSFYN